MKILTQLVLSVVVLAAALYLWVAYVPSARPLIERTGILDLLGIELPEVEAAQDAGPRRGGGPTLVLTTTVEELAMADRITAIGDGRARLSVTVRSKAVGSVTDIAIASGGYIEAGTVIARLEDEAEKIAMEQARIRLDDAEEEATRLRRLQNTGAVTEVREREAELALRNAELAVRQASFDLSQRLIKAPISGWVGIIDIQTGDRVNAQDAIATITDRSDILIDFRVPERVVSKIAMGQTFDVVPLGLRDTTLTGEVSAIDPVIDRTSRTLRVQGKVENSDDRLRAGMAFSIALTFPGETLLSIPPLSLQWSSDGPFVWAIREGKAARVTVAIRQRNSDSVLVDSDALQAGDVIVTEGVQTLRDGAEVAPADRASLTSVSEKPDGKGKL